MKLKVLAISFLLVLQTFLSGCGSASSKVSGQQLAAPSMQIKKIFVLIDDQTNLSSDATLKLSFKLIANRLPVVMKLNGYEAVVVTKSEFATAAASGKADVTHAMFLQPSRTYFNSRVGTEVQISADMTELATKKVIWAGTITFASGNFSMKFDDEAGDAFSKKLLIALKDAQIISFPTVEPVTSPKK